MNMHITSVPTFMFYMHQLIVLSSHMIHNMDIDKRNSEMDVAL